MMQLTANLLGCRRFPSLDGSGLFLMQLCHALHMKPLSGPHVAELPSGVPTKGTSGVLIVCESHLAFHTWPEYSQAYVDVFSCREFSRQVVLDMLQTAFEPLEIDDGYIIRLPLGAAIGGGR